ncbi:secreted RxLR effector protein 161-like [Rutidosis leptorrhynchoides]|uniref:secreted RxLR effector protein 161-like n=1 Tax=Rutidosis leptorrhynchoides TaxID=125765 RepID=UPI003A996CFF
MTCPRSDISYAVGKLGRFTSNPGSNHWQAMNRVFKYLKLTKDFAITYTGFPSILEGYSDASWITNVEDHSSTTGWIFLLGGGAISWASKNQNCITNSAMESEFVALAAAENEAEWLRNKLTILCAQQDSPSFYCETFRRDTCNKTKPKSFQNRLWIQPTDL